jgi:hypothetical protein
MEQKLQFNETFSTGKRTHFQKSRTMLMNSLISSNATLINDHSQSTEQNFLMKRKHLVSSLQNPKLNPKKKMVNFQQLLEWN